MRILTVRQPWAWAIIHGGKDVENRVRNIAGDYRGPVAIHAGLSYDNSADSHDGPLKRAKDAHAVAVGATPFPGGYTWNLLGVDPRKAWSTAGAIIGVVDLVDVHSASMFDGCGRIIHDCPNHGTCRDHCSPWAIGPAPQPHGWYHHLVLANPYALTEPIPYKGALGLRRLDADTIDDINRKKR